MESKLGRSNDDEKYFTNSGSVRPSYQIIPRPGTTSVKPTCIQKESRGPPVVPKWYQRNQAPAYNETEDQRSHKVNQPMSTAPNGELYATEPKPTGIGVTCQRYPYQQIELDEVWRIANVNIVLVFEGLDKLLETKITDRKKLTRNLLVDKAHNYLNMPEDPEKMMHIGPDFILNGAPLYNKYLEKKAQNKDWEEKMQQMHLRLRKKAQDLALNYVVGDLSRVKSTGKYKILDEESKSKHQRSNICRLDQVYEAAFKKYSGMTHMIEDDDEFLVKQIVALNNLELDITNATQKIMKDMAFAMYVKMQRHYSFGNLHDDVVRQSQCAYNQYAKLSGKYAYCSFLLNFVVKKLTDHLDCDDILKEKVMRSAMEHRNLKLDGTCKFEKTFLPRIYLEAKRRLKQTPSMHMKKHKNILNHESATTAQAYAISAMVGLKHGVKTGTGDIHHGKIVTVDPDANDQSMSQSMSQSIAPSMSSGMVARDLNRNYETILPPKVDQKAGLVPFQQQSNKVIARKTAMLEHQTDQGLTVGEEPSLPTIATDKAVIQDRFSVDDSTSLATKSQQKVIVQEETVVKASSDNLNSENNGCKNRPSPSESTVTEDVTKVPKQSTIASHPPYKSNRRLEDIFCHRVECRDHYECKMKPLATHAASNLKGAIKKYHVHSSPCGFGYSVCVFKQDDLVLSEVNTHEVLVQEELESIEEMVDKDEVQHEKRKYEERVHGRFLFGQLNDAKIMKKYKCTFKEFVFICDSCLNEKFSNPVTCCKFCYDAAQLKWEKRNCTGSASEKKTRSSSSRSNRKRNQTSGSKSHMLLIKKKQRKNRTKSSQS